MNAKERTENNNGNGNSSNAQAPAAQEPQRPHEPSAGEVMTISTRIVSMIESWSSDSQRRVLEAVATALGVKREQQRPQQRQQQGQGQRRG